MSFPRATVGPVTLALVLAGAAAPGGADPAHASSLAVSESSARLSTSTGTDALAMLRVSAARRETADRAGTQRATASRRASAERSAAKRTTAKRAAAKRAAAKRAEAERTAARRAAHRRAQQRATKARAAARAAAKKGAVTNPRRPHLTTPTPVRKPRDTSPTRLVQLAPDSPFYDLVATAPLAPNSAQSIASLARQVRDNWGGTAAVNAYSYNTSIVRVAANQKRIRVGYHNCQNKNYMPPGLYDGAKHFVDVPVPDDAIPAGGTDGALALYDPAADQAWEFWQMRKTATGGWEACWGGRIDRVSTSRTGTFPFPFGASASGIITAAGAISIEEARRGTIDHAMNLGILETAMFDRVSWPANRSDGYTKDINALRIGQRLRLDPTVDVDSLKLSPFATMVAKAAQKHGFIVTESSGAVAISTESGAMVQAKTGVNPWGDIIGGPAYSALHGFPWDRMQALPPDYGKP